MYLDIRVAQWCTCPQQPTNQPHTHTHTHTHTTYVQDGNTALHLAAAIGLMDCVDFLVSHEADMYATNAKEETAADVATRTDHREIATKLETQMVFTVRWLFIISGHV